MQQSGTVPLYSFYNYKTGDYFYSTHKGEEKSGYSARGVAGFVFPKATCGGVPLYRLYNKRKRIHYFTTSASEKAMAVRSGYKKEGVVGYMFPKT